MRRLLLIAVIVLIARGDRTRISPPPAPAPQAAPLSIEAPIATRPVLPGNDQLPELTVGALGAVPAPFGWVGDARLGDRWPYEDPLRGRPPEEEPNEVGLRDVLVRPDSEYITGPNIGVIEYIPAAQVGLLRAAWGAPLSDGSRLGPDWRVELVDAPWPHTVGVRFHPYTPLERVLRELEGDGGLLGRQLEDVEDGFRFGERDCSPGLEPDPRGPGCMYATWLPETDVSNAESELLAITDAGRITRLRLELTVDGPLSRERAFAIMQRVWGTPRLEIDRDGTPIMAFHTHDRRISWRDRGEDLSPTGWSLYVELEP